MEKSYMETDSGKIAYLSGGQGNHLLLLHSLNVSSESWKDVFQPLTQKYKVVALDMLGHGDSDKPSKNFLIEDYTRSVIQFMDKRGIEKAIVCGNSVGALLAVDLAASFPKRVEKLILVGCPARDAWERMERLVFSGLSLDAQGNPLPLSLAALSMTLAHPTPELLDWFNQQRAKAGLWVKNTMIAIALYDIFPKLPLVKCPTLVLFGAKDILAEKEKELLKGIKGAKSAILPDAGHVPQVDQPQAFLQAIDRFLNSQ